MTTNEHNDVHHMNDDTIVVGNVEGGGSAINNVDYLIGGLSRSSLETTIPLNQGLDNIICIESVLSNGKYLVKWLQTGQLEEISPDDVSDHAKMVNREVTKHNQTINSQGNTNQSSKAIIYTRISSANETPIDTQLYYCSNYAKQRGLKLQPYGYLIDNGVSGRNGHNIKQGELSIFGDIIESGSTIIINSIDRLCRHTVTGMQFLEKMNSRNVSVYFVTEQIHWHSDMDTNLKRRVRDSLSSAEEFSDILSKKLKLSVQMRKNQGHFVGRAGYGFKTQRVNNIMKKVKVNVEIATIKNIILWTNEHLNIGGRPKFSNTVHSLTNNEMYTRNGKNFTYEYVSRLYHKYKTQAL